MLGLLSSTVHAQHAVPKTLTDLVDEAESIVVAQLESAQPRWNSRHTLIVTDYRFRIERGLLGGKPREQWVLSQGGGSLDGETHRLSSNPELRIGARYLMFVRADRGEVFAPFVAGGQGIYRIGDDGEAEALAGGGRRPLDTLVHDVDRLLQVRGNEPPHRYQPAALPVGMHYPSKVYVPRGVAARPNAGPHGEVPLSAENADRPAVIRSAAMSANEGAGTDASPPWVVYNHYGPTVNPPVVYDELPHDWTWSPQDQYQMSEWNRYAGNLFRVSGSELGTWAFRNDRFELVGWPDNQTMINQFGEGWDTNTLAITWSLSNASNVIVEADIAFNPAFCWTLDEYRGSDPDDACWAFQQTMLHELGHGWGLDHPWEHQDVWWDSVMNYSPKANRLSRLNTDDVNAVRGRYNGPAISDGLISQYRTSDSTTSNQPIYSPALPTSISVQHGGTLSLAGPIQIENLGTTNIVNPAVEIYLGENWNAWSGNYVYLRTANFASTIGTFSTFTYNLNATTIPATVPTGLYYLTLWLDNADDYSGNNTASSNPDVMVTVNNVAPLLAPAESWRATAVGHIGPSGRWDFRLPVSAGKTYELTTCASGLGSATFDTIIEIVGAGVSNDDYCGLQSRVQWTAAATQTRTIRVTGYSAAQGDFVLGYRLLVTDRLYSSGFDGN